MLLPQYLTEIEGNFKSHDILSWYGKKSVVWHAAKFNKHTWQFYLDHAMLLSNILKSRPLPRTWLEPNHWVPGHNTTQKPSQIVKEVNRLTTLTFWCKNTQSRSNPCITTTIDVTWNGSESEWTTSRNHHLDLSVFPAEMSGAVGLPAALTRSSPEGTEEAERNAFESATLLCPSWVSEIHHGVRIGKACNFSLMFPPPYSFRSDVCFRPPARRTRMRTQNSLTHGGRASRPCQCLRTGFHSESVKSVESAWGKMLWCFLGQQENSYVYHNFLSGYYYHCSYILTSAAYFKCQRYGRGCRARAIFYESGEFVEGGFHNHDRNFHLPQTMDLRQRIISTTRNFPSLTFRQIVHQEGRRYVSNSRQSLLTVMFT